MRFSSKVVFAPACALALAIAGCSSAENGSSTGATSAKDGDPITIVASTAIWADIAKAVAETSQADVEVSAVVTGNGIDPHHFEPTAADLARAQEADIIVAGGGGYDAWLYEPLQDQDKVIAPLPLVGHGEHGHDHGHEHGDEHAHDEHTHESEAAHDHAHESEAAHDEHGHEGHNHSVEGGRVETIDGNEHIWYSPDAITIVAEDIATAINKANPKANASADAVVKDVQGIEERLHSLPKMSYAQTEPIADYILAHSEMKDVTPESYRDTTLSENEPAAADLAQFLSDIEAGKIDLLVYNPQTKTDLTERIRKAAETKGVKIVEIGETPPENTNFFDYYHSVVDALTKTADAS